MLLKKVAAIVLLTEFLIYVCHHKVTSSTYCPRLSYRPPSSTGTLQ